MIEGKKVAVSDRERNTLNRRFGCPVRYCLSYKQVCRGDPDSKRHFVGRWKNDTHEGHALPVNCLSLPGHRQRFPAFQQARGLAMKYRFASIKYSTIQKLLNEDMVGVSLKQKEYYNLKRHQPFDARDDESAAALLQALTDEGFRWRTFVRDTVDELDSSKIVSRKLIQIVFWHPEACILARRFCAGHLLEVDATFNTNNLRMPLMTSLGITNEGKGFPVAFSYCPGETAEAYVNFLTVVKEDIISESVAEIAVILADMSSGIISAVDTYKILSPYQQLQFCSWHAVEAIKARVRKGGYTSNELSVVDDLVWKYIQAETLAELDLSRTALSDFLRPGEQEYLAHTWRSKEARTVRCHTNLLRNLGRNSTQSLESFHNVVHQVTHGQLALHKSAHALAIKLKEIYAQRQEDEDTAWTKKATGLNTSAFQELRGHISILAIQLIETELISIAETEDEKDKADNTPCSCTNNMRYSLPCKHQLSRLPPGTAIPLALVHPRWWLHGPPAPLNWQPSWGKKPLILSPKKADSYSRWREIWEEREKFSGDSEGQARFDRQIALAASNLKAAAEYHRTLEALPLGKPDKVPKKTWTRTKPTQNARALTANECRAKLQQRVDTAQAQQARDALILQQRQEEEQHTPQVHEQATVQVPSTPTPPPPPPPPIQPAPRPPTPPPEPPSFELPLSTAPPALEGPKTKRTRGKTLDFVALSGNKRTRGGRH
jgi:hypothetical protein